MLRHALGLAALVVAPSLAAQQAPPGPPPAPPAVAAMQRLDWLSGEWRGSGWIEMGPRGRVTFGQRETVRPAAGGTVVVIDGLGTTPAPGGGPDRVVLSALGVIAFDAAAQGYRFRAYRGDGNVVDVEATVGDGKFVWGYHDVRAGDVRYTITRSDAGEWVEEGDASRDAGATWRQFFEMRLQRQP